MTATTRASNVRWCSDWSGTGRWKTTGGEEEEPVKTAYSGMTRCICCPKKKNEEAWRTWVKWCVMVTDKDQIRWGRKAKLGGTTKSRWSGEETSRSCRTVERGGKVWTLAQRRAVCDYMNEGTDDGRRSRRNGKQWSKDKVTKVAGTEF